MKCMTLVVTSSYTARIRHILLRLVITTLISYSSLHCMHTNSEAKILLAFPKAGAPGYISIRTATPDMLQRFALLTRPVSASPKEDCLIEIEEKLFNDVVHFKRSDTYSLDQLTLLASTARYLQDRQEIIYNALAQARSKVSEGK